MEHRHFFLYIDNATLQWIRTLAEPVQGLVQRWLQTLANSDFTVVHRLGKNHGNADALGRAPHLKEDPTLDLDVSMGEMIGALVASLNADTAWTHEMVREGQEEEDEEISLVRGWVSEETKPTTLELAAITTEGNKLAGLDDTLYLNSNQVLRYKAIFGKDMGLPEIWNLLILPESMRKGDIDGAHVAVSHKAIEATEGEL